MGYYPTKTLAKYNNFQDYAFLTDAACITCRKPTPRQAGSCREGWEPMRINCCENQLRVQAIGGDDACARASSRGRGRSEKRSVEGCCYSYYILPMPAYIESGEYDMGLVGKGFLRRRERGPRAVVDGTPSRTCAGPLCERYIGCQLCLGLRAARGRKVR